MGARKGSATTYALDPAAREQMILQNLPLVHHVIGRLAIGRPGLIDREDLVAHGVVGLIQAVDRYDPGHGVPFGPWATIRIRGAVIDAIRGLDVVNPGTRQQVRRLQSAIGDLTARLGRTPTDDEVRAALGLGAAGYAELLDAAACQVVSLDSTTDAEGAPLANLLPGGEDHAESGAIRATIAQAVRRLDKREQLLLSLYYAEGMTCQEIGEVLGIHKTGVVRLHARAIVKLRALLGVEDAAGELASTTEKTDEKADRADHGGDPNDVARAAGPPRPGNHPRRESGAAAGLGRRYAGARRAYLSGRGVELGGAAS